MAADAGEGVARPVLGRNEAPIVTLEIEDAIAEKLCAPHLLAKAFRNHSKILADDDGAVLLGDFRQNADELGHRIERICAIVGGVAGRNPEQPVEAHRVVYPQRAGVLQDRSIGLPHGQEITGGDLGRRHGGKTPFLPIGIEHVRRCADLGSDKGQGAVAPCCSPVGCGPDRKIEIEADTHSRLAQPASGAGELAVGGPLKPDLELDIPAALARKAADGSTLRIAQFIRPGMPACAHAVRHHVHADRLEQREALQRFATLGDEGGKLAFRGGAASFEDAAERLDLA